MIPFGGNYGDYYNYYNSFYNPYSGALDAVLGVLSSLVLASLLIAVVMFVFESIALYTLAKKRGIKNAFLAFIPVADSYILGKIYDDISATMNKKTGYAVRMVVLASVALVSGVFACVFLGMSAVIGFAGGEAVMFIFMAVPFLLVQIGCTVALLIFTLISLYAVYKEYVPSNAVLFLVLSVIIPVTMPFLLFSIRNKKSGYQLWCEQRAAAQAWAAAQQNCGSAGTSAVSSDSDLHENRNEDAQNQ